MEIKQLIKLYASEETEFQLLSEIAGQNNFEKIIDLSLQNPDGKVEISDLQSTAPKLDLQSAILALSLLTNVTSIVLRLYELNKDKTTPEQALAEVKKSIPEKKLNVISKIKGVNDIVTNILKILQSFK